MYLQLLINKYLVLDYLLKYCWMLDEVGCMLDKCWVLSGMYINAFGMLVGERVCWLIGIYKLINAVMTTVPTVQLTRRMCSYLHLK
jgi:hypothetical protein